MLPVLSNTSTPLRYASHPVNRQRWLRELCELLAFPTVSAHPQQHPAIEAAARWLAKHLHSIGLQHAQVLPGVEGGPPSVYADWLAAPGRPTVLLYGHYDVQPAEPRNEWHTPPFEPTRIGDTLFARGASDDKGQLFIHLKAIESYIRTGGLPLNVKIWLEGEEEINSPNIGVVLAREATRLKADAVLVSDTFMLSPDRPAIIYGLRGGLVFEVEVIGPRHDLHSGVYGGAIHNPLHALSNIITSLHDATGRVGIPGFYDYVREAEAGERHDLRYASLPDAQFFANTGVGAGWGEEGYSLFERTTIRPALVVHGMSGGYTGAGSKAIIPRRAVARIGVRLVPEQDPMQIAGLVRQHIARVTPPTVGSRVHISGSSRPVLIARRHPAMSAAVRAVYQTWGVPPLFTRSGGSIPAVAEFQRRFGVPVILLGFGLPTDNIHAPNEHIAVPRMFQGVETIIRFLAEYAHDH